MDLPVDPGPDVFVNLMPEELREPDSDPDAALPDDEDDDSMTFDDTIRKHILPNLTPGQQRYMVVTPELLKQRRKLDEANKKRRAKAAEKRALKRKAVDAVDNGNDSDDMSKKAKPLQEITVYVLVELAVAKVTSGSAKSKGASVACKPVQKGPFFHSLDDDYRTFQSLLAKALPCKEKLLPLEEIQWKYDKPANDKKKLMSNEAGYKAMVLSIQERKKDYVIYIHMPPPLADSVSWDTGEDDHVEKPFKYSDAIDEVIPEELSACAQIMNTILILPAAMSANLAENLKLLTEKYVVGACALFPGKRIYQDGKRYWELTSLRLQVWANAISQGKATLKSPPVSNHFSEQAKLRIPAAGPDLHLSAFDFPTANSATTMPPYMTPYPQNPYAYMSHPFYPPPPPPPPNMYYPPHMPNPYQYATYGPQNPNPYTPHTPHANSTHIGSPQVSPRKALRLNIPLDIFCTRYGIPDTDHDKLVSLEYRPGMPAIDQLPEKEWMERVGFSVLAWESFKDAHKQFIKDVREGKWDTS